MKKWITADFEIVSNYLYERRVVQKFIQSEALGIKIWIDNIYISESACPRDYVLEIAKYKMYCDSVHYLDRIGDCYRDVFTEIKHQTPAWQ